MGEEQIREVGHSFLNHVFGGTMHSTSLPQVPPGEVVGQRFTMTDRILKVTELFMGYNQTP